MAAGGAVGGIVKGLKHLVTVKDPEDELEINRLHQKLQGLCGHRGLPAGDKHHMDSRKGPSKEVVQQLHQLEAAYAIKHASRASFAPPQSDQPDGTAPWRKWEFSCFSQVGDDGLLDVSIPPP